LHLLLVAGRRSSASGRRKQHIVKDIIFAAIIVAVDYTVIAANAVIVDANRVGRLVSSY
jgi:hypothetical protein